MFVLCFTGIPKYNLYYRNEVESRTILQELLLYFIFLTILCICKYTDVDEMLLELKLMWR